MPPHASPSLSFPSPNSPSPLSNQADFTPASGHQNSSTSSYKLHKSWHKSLRTPQNSDFQCFDWSVWDNMFSMKVTKFIKY